jgi:hypothetical protein
MTKRLPGGQPGNQNATKNQIKKMWSCRLSETVIGLIDSRAKALGISKSEYIKRLVIQDHL